MWDILKYVPFKHSYFVTQLLHQDLRLRGAKFKVRNNGFCAKSVKDNRQENNEKLSFDLKISALKDPIEEVNTNHVHAIVIQR